MLLAVTSQCCGLNALHRQQELLFPRARRVERQKARVLRTLNACTLTDFAYRTFLRRLSELGMGGQDWKRRTSFHRCLDIRSTPVIGSMNTSLATRVSGTHMAQSKCTQSPNTVCLKAPPSLGHRM